MKNVIMVVIFRNKFSVTYVCEVLIKKKKTQQRQGNHSFQHVGGTGLRDLCARY